jgi:hypothetical protein
MVVLISWDCQMSEINNSMTLEVEKAHDVGIWNLHSVEIVADI